MIRRLLLTSGLVLAGAVAFSPKALAQSVDVMFEGNIGPECSFAAPVPGTLVYAGGPQTNPGPLSGPITSDAPGGVSGKVDVSCNTPGVDIQISDARFVSFTPTNPDPGAPPLPPGAFGSPLEVRARVPGAQTFYFGSAEGGGTPSPSMALFPIPLAPNQPLQQTVEVDMSVDTPNPKAGIYTYKATLTIVP
ncbi:MULTISPECIES: hypothetical protein [unclassified Coleofasciculus]|uniref:hypothetical protein n=1 Tax=unclassified Coleofasciculus TaxID=2692782 RepID=UPI001882375C|nr:MULTISPECIES: hypothetical protein [unclassified Coleofasciculus]MBE9124621.1 hypothetical protein [Coleofasciculus sp. LEGE 07081]MBE9147585.1 hypothetical protein [Coleofasciculus sp. LEGE 07092]